jgi:hypothetical protein
VKLFEAWMMACCHNGAEDLVLEDGVAESLEVDAELQVK